MKMKMKRKGEAMRKKGEAMKRKGKARRRRLLLTGVLIAVLGSAYFIYAGSYVGGDVFSQASKFFKDAQRFIITVSTPAALIGVGCGAFMKKFSMGDPQKIKSGGQLISASLIGWTFINGLTLLLSTIQKYI